MKIGYVLALSSLIAFQAVADDSQDAPLSYSTEVLQPPIVDDAQVHLAADGALSKSDTLALIKKQTAVKAQGARNLCTVFSVTGVVESLYLITTGFKQIDLSEEWLHYVYTQGSASGGAAGAYQTTLLANIQAHGLAREAAMPYINSVWTTETPIAAQRCANLSGKSLTRCLMAHHRPGFLGVDDSVLLNKSSLNYDPEFVEARQSANEFKAFTNSLTGGVVSSVSQIKSRLRQGLPLSLKLQVFFGSWNHGGGTKLGIDIDPNLFAKGIVTYPEARSVDAVKSAGEGAIHSVVLVGYDDNVAVTYSKKMTDGSTKTFTRKGVYYFKNSWGTAKFGSSFKLGNNRIRGFGMILQDYAHMGEFLAIDVRGVSL